MKLLTKTTLYFLLAMIPLLAGGGYLLFSRFSKEINERVDRELVYDALQWIQYLEATTANGSQYFLRSPDVYISPVNRPPEQYPQFTTTYGTKAKSSTQIPFRQLSHVVAIHGIPYQLIIRKSQEQRGVLVANITWTMLVVFAGLFIAMLLFNWIISERLWQPFRASLQKLRNVALQQMETVHFEETTVREFNELNSTLNAMTRKIHSDYVNMKEFTENAAHEMQTPLAVAQTKMELLLQDPTLSEPQLEAISQATTALNRLGKLNQSLLLLAKIENNQYAATEPVNLADYLQKYLRLFDEIIQDKKLRLETRLEDDFRVKLHPFLADSLVSNLLGNAIKYNYTGGKLLIAVNSDQLCISNTSELPAIDSHRLFKRFTAASGQPATSTGLGLAIAKKIADTHHLSITYQFQNAVHRFCVSKA
jgi:signal transduction histidine kinase